MLVIIGYVIVLGSVFGGYVMMGGHLGVLYQPLEFLIIGGAAVGSFVAGNDKKTLRATMKELPKLVRASKKHDKALYMELLALLYVLLLKGRKDGMMALESDIEDPQNSAIFAPYQVILNNAPVIEFMTYYLLLVVRGNKDTFDIVELMEH